MREWLEKHVKCFNRKHSWLVLVQDKSTLPSHLLFSLCLINPFSPTEIEHRKHWSLYLTQFVYFHFSLTQSYWFLCMISVFMCGENETESEIISSTLGSNFKLELVQSWLLTIIRSIGKRKINSWIILLTNTRAHKTIILQLPQTKDELCDLPHAKKLLCAFLLSWRSNLYFYGLIYNLGDPSVPHGQWNIFHEACSLLYYKDGANNLHK